MKTNPQPEDFLPLKPNWFHVLLSLAGEGQHGYGIMTDVSQIPVAGCGCAPARCMPR